MTRLKKGDVWRETEMTREKKSKKHRGDVWHVDKTTWRGDAWRVDKNMTLAQIGRGYWSTLEDNKRGGIN